MQTPQINTNSNNPTSSQNNNQTHQNNIVFKSHQPQSNAIKNGKPLLKTIGLSNILPNLGSNQSSRQNSLKKQPESNIKINQLNSNNNNSNGQSYGQQIKDQLQINQAHHFSSSFKSGQLLKHSHTGKLMENKSKQVSREITPKIFDTDLINNPLSQLIASEILQQSQQFQKYTQNETQIETHQFNIQNSDNIQQQSTQQLQNQEQLLTKSKKEIVGQKFTDNLETDQSRTSSQKTDNSNQFDSNIQVNNNMDKKVINFPLHSLSHSPNREKRRDTVMNTNRPKPFIKIDDDDQGNEGNLQMIQTQDLNTNLVSSDSSQINSPIGNLALSNQNSNNEQKFQVNQIKKKGVVIQTNNLQPVTHNGSNQVWFRPQGNGNQNAGQFLDAQSNSLMLSPINNNYLVTKPSIMGSSSSTSFDVNCFSFNNDTNGSNYYALVGPDGQPNSFFKIGDQQYQIISPQNQQNVGNMLKQGSKIMLLENSLEQFKDIDEESIQDEGSSIEEIKTDDDRIQSINGIPTIQRKSKKSKQLRNHILIFKNPMELLDRDGQNSGSQQQREDNQDGSPLISKKNSEYLSQEELPEILFKMMPQNTFNKNLIEEYQQVHRASNETLEDEDLDEGSITVQPAVITGLHTNQNSINKFDESMNKSMMSQSNQSEDRKSHTVQKQKSKQSQNKSLIMGSSNQKIYLRLPKGYQEKASPLTVINQSLRLKETDSPKSPKIIMPRADLRETTSKTVANSQTQSIKKQIREFNSNLHQNHQLTPFIGGVEASQIEEERNMISLPLQSEIIIKSQINKKFTNRNQYDRAYTGTSKLKDNRSFDDKLDFKMQAKINQQADKIDFKKDFQEKFQKDKKAKNNMRTINFSANQHLKNAIKVVNNETYYNTGDEIFSDDDVPHRQNSMGNEVKNTMSLDLYNGSKNYSGNYLNPQYSASNHQNYLQLNEKYQKNQVSSAKHSNQQGDPQLIQRILESKQEQLQKERHLREDAQLRLLHIEQENLQLREYLNHLLQIKLLKACN